MIPKDVSYKSRNSHADCDKWNEMLLAPDRLEMGGKIMAAEELIVEWKVEELAEIRMRLGMRETVMRGDMQP